MANENLVSKNIIDVGEIGNASTGDILFDGGVKINANTKQIYNTFGDKRLVDLDNQRLHATGYYQKPTRQEWQAAIQMGEMRDVDASVDAVFARVEKGKVGEGVVFINSNGSISPEHPLEIQVQDTFVSVPSGNLRVTTPYCRVTIWCISDEGGVSRWDYSIESMFGQKLIPLDKTYILNNTAREIPITTHGEYNTIKLLMTAATASVVGTKKFKASETLLYIDSIAKTITSTEYAVMRGGQVDDDDEIYDIEFKYNGDKIVASASSTTAGIRLAIKVIDTQTFGVNL